jgi:mono/diheme cytochrome c family protein
MPERMLVRSTGKLFVLGVFAVAGLLTAQWTSAAKTAPQSTELFKQKVLPILEANCTACHGAKIQRSRLDLRTEEAILKGGTRGPSVVPGAPDKSVLYRMVIHKEEPAMPMGGDKLSDAEIAVIAEWINKLTPVAAAANTEHGPPTRQAGYSITDKDRQFWAFVKPVRPAIPTVKNKAWVRNEIDAFVLSKLEANGLQPSPHASPRELLRRVYFDLIGLPPTPEEMAAFLKNPSEQAYQQVIDKLLASPHYGERWGRHWLDLARYADSGGYEFDYDRPHAWRYRDYVIKAFNADKPYDQFVREQLANDLIAGTDNAEALIPTGFLRNGPTVDNVEDEETRTDELDDMISTTSAVFQGLTVGCARCHDHKYDPIPQRDYYRLQAVFFPFKKTEKTFATPAEQEAHKALNKTFDEKVRPFRQQIAAIEKPVREKLMREKIEFHVNLAKKSSGFGELTEAQFREETSKRLYKEVNLQAEEIEAELSPEALKQRKELQKQIDEINKQRPKPLPSAMGITDVADPKQAHLLKRGDWRNKGEAVNPGLPCVLTDGKDLPPQNRRRQLAEFIASPDNPLTARVAVNRIWQYHFGKGIVKTPSDFGATGDRPSHPELLDFLATEFVKRGWSWKAMHRLMLISNTYRQASQHVEAGATKDPENRLLWRFNPRRIEAEVLRDSLLAVSGKLNTEMYGPGVYPRIDPDVVNAGSRPRWPLDAKDESATFRRSVYIFIKRSVLVPLIEVFDCPVTVVSAPMRPVSTVSPQALALLNNQFVLEQAGFMAERVVREAGTQPRAQVRRGFLLALGRQPSVKEMQWSLEFLKTQAAGHAERKTDKPETAALRDFCHALVNLNEFLYVD